MHQAGRRYTFTFLSLLKKATVVAETTRTIYFSASVNLFFILFTKISPSITPNTYRPISKQSFECFIFIIVFLFCRLSFSLDIQWFRQIAHVSVVYWKYFIFLVLPVPESLKAMLHAPPCHNNVSRYPVTCNMKKFWLEDSLICIRLAFGTLNSSTATLGYIGWLHPNLVMRRCWKSKLR